MSDLYCNGIKLDTDPAHFGELRDSNDVLTDIAACKVRMAQDGYLLFRNLIDRDVILEARREIMLKYAIVGEVNSVDHSVMDGIQQTSSFIDQVNLIAFNESILSGVAYNRVVLNERLISFYEGLLGGDVRCFDFKWPRFTRPGENCGIHSDVVYVGRGTRDLWSSWIPIGDVPREEGALMLLENSHCATQLESYWAKDADRDKVGWLADDPRVLQRELGGRWLTTDFRAGDVLCFSIYIVHASMDNRSPVQRCRLTSDTRYQLASAPLDERWNGDISNPHGGARKVFLPGLGRSNNNKEFEEEWKPVDTYGRLLRRRSAVENLVERVRSHRCFQHPIFHHWAETDPEPEVIGAMFHQIQNFCASTRPGWNFPRALAEHGFVKQSHLLDEIVESEANHGPELATMAGFIVNRRAKRPICADVSDQQAVERQLQLHSDQLLGTLPGYDRTTGLTRQVRELIAILDRRKLTDRESTLRNLGTALALEIISNRHLIPGEKHCLVDSGLYDATLDQPEMHYLLEHWGEAGAEEQHENKVVSAVGAVIDEASERTLVEGVDDFVQGLESLWDLLDTALLTSGHRARTSERAAESRRMVVA